MSPNQIAQTRQTLGLLGRTREQLPFAYCPRGEDGLPVLLLAADHIDPAAILDLMENARSDLIARGSLARAEDGGLIFRLDAPQHAAQLLADLDGSLEEMFPGLRLARVDLG